MHERTLGEIAASIGGRVYGDPHLIIRAAATLSQARPGDLGFLVNPKYEKQLESTQASAVIVGPEVVTDFGLRMADCGLKRASDANPQSTSSAVALIVAEDPYFAFRQALVLLYGHRRHKEVGISPQASIAASAQVGKDCHIHAFATVADDARIGVGCILYPCVYIGPGVHLGSDCIVYPNVTIHDGCRIASRVILHANSTIGVDGFGYATHEGVHHKIPQIGGVIVEDDVEIGSSCSIQRGTLDDTVIGAGSKLGDLVTIGHGTRIGPHCLLVAQVGIAGSTMIGHHCTIGGQVGVVGHITIGNNVTIGAQAGVINSIPDGETVLGAPAIDAGQARRAYTMLPYLPQMRQDIRALQNQLEKLAAERKEREQG
ncbi:MAG: UDP-3-O-(3-hydroxymyristoyl)glucosamine N-acyltransferase [Planctomycetes bacterium]|jgi:UDP-3-O-[3-hydroxymyristoyl] glucosamine N-acyltransferase|nr:UDP-3-O-(3-hydroxymyristoyl)glucosamine N-acyltransferase [Planctomycetota bacterium]